MVFFTIYLPGILEDPDRHQNLISSLLYHPRPLHKMSLVSFHNFLSNAAYKQTNQHKQKHKPPFAKEVMRTWDFDSSWSRMIY